MPGFKATEFDVETGERTGRVEHYTARGAREAAKRVLYTHKLKNGRCRVGPTGRVIHCAGKAWVVTREKRRRKASGL